jgi:hypothetical protein
MNDTAQDESGSQARARRLLCVREMSGLSRDKIQHRYGIARGTLQNWESARFGGLTVKGARAMIKAYLAEGIICDLEWLLHGIGGGPIYKKKESVLPAQPEKGYARLIDAGLSGDKASIAQEILYFRNNSPNAIDMVVQDDAMAPYLNQGDYIAGFKVYQEDIEKLVGKHCIVQTSEHGLMVRLLTPSAVLNRYCLQARNVFTKKCPYVADCEILFAAEVVWVRNNGFSMPASITRKKEKEPAASALLA